MIDHDKLIRLSGELDARHAQIHGLNSHYHSMRDDLARLKAQVFTGMLVRHEAWHPTMTLAQVLELPAEDLQFCRVDTPLVRRGAALENAITDVRRRIDAAQADVVPLAQLVGRLTAYAEGR